MNKKISFIVIIAFAFLAAHCSRGSGCPGKFSAVKKDSNTKKCGGATGAKDAEKSGGSSGSSQLFPTGGYGGMQGD